MKEKRKSSQACGMNHGRNVGQLQFASVVHWLSACAPVPGLPGQQEAKQGLERSVLRCFHLTV